MSLAKTTFALCPIIRGGRARKRPWEMRWERPWDHCPGIPKGPDIYPSLQGFFLAGVGLVGKATLMGRRLFEYFLALKKYCLATASGGRTVGWT